MEVVHDTRWYPDLSNRRSRGVDNDGPWPFDEDRYRSSLYYRRHVWKLIKRVEGQKGMDGRYHVVSSVWIAAAWRRGRQLNREIYGVVAGW